MGAALRKLEPIEFVIRPGVDADVPFVTRSWACGQRVCAPWKYQDGETFTRLHNGVMRDGLAVRRCLIAQLPDDPEARLGFVVGDARPPSLHIEWVYVREKFRGRGIAHGLVSELGRAGCLEVVSRGWSKDAKALVGYTLRRHGLSFRWAP